MNDLRAARMIRRFSGFVVGLSDSPQNSQIVPPSRSPMMHGSGVTHVMPSHMLEPCRTQNLETDLTLFGMPGYASGRRLLSLSFAVLHIRNPASFGGLEALFYPCSCLWLVVLQSRACLPPASSGVPGIRGPDINCPVEDAKHAIHIAH